LKAFIAILGVGIFAPTADIFASGFADGSSDAEEGYPLLITNRVIVLNIKLDQFLAS
jgi:hypothetical protein